ncbi:MAG: hypothetical protein Q8O75_03905 [bacterium]|nr:hypothetical protein [bacterium]
MVEIPTPQVNRPPSPSPTPSPVPNERGKNITILVIVVLVVLVVFTAIWFALKSLNTTNETAGPMVTPTSQTDTVAPVQSDSDLQKLQNDLEQTSFNDFDTTLNANDADAASF